LRPILALAAATAGLTIALLLASGLIQRPAETAVRHVAGSDVALWVHAVAATIALPLGGYVLWARKGNARHKLLGRIWAAAMLIIAISSFWLRSLSGGFSFIHLLSILTLVSIPLGIWHARQGKVQLHLRTMRGVYIGLVVAGVFAVLPGRLLGTMLFG
jgi:uncharacterized membrane protein